MRVPGLIVVACLAVGCGSARYSARETGSPSVTVPVHFAEGHGGGGPPASPTGTANPPRSSVATAPSAVPPPGAVPSEPVSRRPVLPDPAPLVTANQWDFDLVYEKGTLRSRGVRRVVLQHPTPTPRRFGRFAVELWLGKELVDRVRFDFPLLGGDAVQQQKEGVKRPLHTAPRFAPGAETSAHVMVPDSDRATSALLVDRLTYDAVPLPWPPTVTEGPEEVDGGVAKAR